jgi:DNA-binding CsgD family transcriptional regulator
MTKLPSSSPPPAPPRKARVLTKRPSIRTSLGQPLSERELEVLRLVAEGLSNKNIARRLKRSEHTVKFHLGNAAKKIGVSSRTEAAVYFTLQQGTVLSPTPASSKSHAPLHRKDDDNVTQKQSWINGFAAALAQVHRHGVESTAICQAAHFAGLTLAAASGAGVSPFDISELRRAKVQ